MPTVNGGRPPCDHKQERWSVIHVPVITLFKCKLRDFFNSYSVAAGSVRRRMGLKGALHAIDANGWAVLQRKPLGVRDQHRSERAGDSYALARAAMRKVRSQGH
jgi:hypothetical protein